MNQNFDYKLNSNQIYKKSNGSVNNFNLNSNSKTSHIEASSLYTHGSSSKANSNLYTRGFPGGITNSSVQIPSQKLEEYLKTEESIKKIKDELKFVDYKVLYKTICKTARVIPEIQLLEVELSENYSIQIIKNIINLKTNSPLFYVNNIKDETSFIVYQAFIYLISMIIYVCDRSHSEEFIKKDTNMPIVITWCLARNLPDLQYILTGPITMTNYNIDYKTLYKTLISSSNEVFEKGVNIISYMQLMSLKKNEEYMLEFIKTLEERKNSYSKLQNLSETYMITYDTEYGCYPETDINGDLIINCQEVEIGNTLNDKINMNINEILKTNKELKIDSKISSGKLNELLTYYNTIKINRLTVRKNAYQTNLDLFSTIFIVFPDIYLITRTNQIHTNGSLQISGHFDLKNNTTYEFIPDRKNGISFKETTTYVKKITYLITDKPGQKSSLVYFEPILNVSKNYIYNCPLLIPLNNPAKYNSSQLEILKQKNTENYIFVFYDYYLKVVPKSVFVYNSTNKIIQWLDINNELIVENESFELIYNFDTNYVYSTDIKIEDLVTLEDNSDIKYLKYLSYSDCKYKAFKSDFDFLNETWNTSDYLYSIYQLTPGNKFELDDYYTDYSNLTDFKFSIIDQVEPLPEIYVRYYIKKIEHTIPLMTLNYPTRKINSTYLIYKNKKYILQKLKENLIVLGYFDIIDDVTITLYSDLNMNLILELC